MIASMFSRHALPLSLESGKGERITASPSPQNWACELSPHPAQANHDASACLLLADGPRWATVNLVMAIEVYQREVGIDILPALSAWGEVMRL